MQEMFSKCNEATLFLKSFSNPNRLMILCCLLEQKRNVTQITQLTGLPQAAISNQLALLRESQLIDCEKNHRERLYYIKDARVLELMQLMHRFFCASSAN
ncbi:ArsR/SmtB family transcription factor [[Pasteurella] aerogenes]|nr:winged helix-turn-helix transcriptional regulator [[Pasteurella] aerogenes]MDY2796882.1 metalloregulator ArsR/SmtB family transcription factor [[Pasteurella] aerogenes]UWZ93532.1 winged helix-turn-helix transcriptional regulator [[Pasteurella] aerogenes]VEG72608.1 HTH transcriptional regulator, ArsR family protein [[Pasteurella] aerogenes]